MNPCTRARGPIWLHTQSADQVPGTAVPQVGQSQSTRFAGASQQETVQPIAPYSLIPGSAYQVTAYHVPRVHRTCTRQRGLKSDSETSIQFSFSVYLIPGTWYKTTGMLYGCRTAQALACVSNGTSAETGAHISPKGQRHKEILNILDLTELQPTSPSPAR